MAEHDVAMGQRRAIFGQLFQAKDDRIRRGFWPKILIRYFTSRRNVAIQRNGPHGGAFHRHPDACLDQRRSTLRRQADAFLVRALFGPYP
jgi:hypothetical protein